MEDPRCYIFWDNNCFEDNQRSSRRNKDQLFNSNNHSKFSQNPLNSSKKSLKAKKHRHYSQEDQRLMKQAYRGSNQAYNSQVSSIHPHGEHPPKTQFTRVQRRVQRAHPVALIPLQPANHQGNNYLNSSNRLQLNSFRIEIPPHNSQLMRQPTQRDPNIRKSNSNGCFVPPSQFGNQFHQGFSNMGSFNSSTVNTPPNYIIQSSGMRKQLHPPMIGSFKKNAPPYRHSCDQMTSRQYKEYEPKPHFREVKLVPYDRKVQPINNFQIQKQIPQQKVCSVPTYLDQRKTQRNQKKETTNMPDSLHLKEQNISTKRTEEVQLSNRQNYLSKRSPRQRPTKQDHPQSFKYKLPDRIHKQNNYTAAKMTKNRSKGDSNQNQIIPFYKQKKKNLNQIQIAPFSNKICQKKQYKKKVVFQEQTLPSTNKNSQKLIDKKPFCRNLSNFTQSSSNKKNSLISFNVPTTKTIEGQRRDSVNIQMISFLDVQYLQKMKKNNKLQLTSDGILKERYDSVVNNGKIRIEENSQSSVPSSAHILEQEESPRQKSDQVNSSLLNSFNKKISIKRYQSEASKKSPLLKLKERTSIYI